MLRSLRRVRLEALLYLVGLVGLIVALRATSDSGAVSAAVEHPGPVVLATALCLVAQLAAGANWVLLLGVDRPRAVQAVRALYAAQLTKYVPAGGVMQVASQVVLTKRLGVALGKVTMCVLLANWHVVVMGAALGSYALFSASSALVVRVGALLLMLTPVLVSPPVLRRGVTLLRRVSGRIPEASELPSSASLVGAATAALVNFLALAGAFAVMLRTVDGSADLALAGSAFALAWVAGFIVLPLPGGIGVREAVLVGVVSAPGSGAVLAAAVVFRFVTLAAEVIAWAVATWATRRVPTTTSTVQPSSQR